MSTNKVVGKRILDNSVLLPFQRAVEISTLNEAIGLVVGEEPPLKENRLQVGGATHLLPPFFSHRFARFS